MSFRLDTRLEKDTLPFGRFELCDIRLLNDSRWPWLVLIPMLDGCSEIFDLDEKSQIQLARETGWASQALKKMTGAEKINTGALSNIVRQLHIHVIARSEDDANWPGPVWGFGKPDPYRDTAAKTLIDKLRNELSTHVL